MKSEFVVKELSTAELQERLDSAKVELNKMRMNHHISPLENPNLIKAHKKNIARILTELRRRELDE